MATTGTNCWADPLSSMERKELRLKLARACRASWDAGDMRRFAFRSDAPARSHAHEMTSREMADLHLDVTERAERATG